MIAVSSPVRLDFASCISCLRCPQAQDLFVGRELGALNEFAPFVGIGEVAGLYEDSGLQRETLRVRRREIRLTRMRERPDASGQSGFAPESLTTLPHFSVSSAMSFPKSL